MKPSRKIEIEEIAGVWIITENDKSRSYVQTGKDDYRFVKDLIKDLSLMNVEVRERG